MDQIYDPTLLALNPVWTSNGRRVGPAVERVRGVPGSTRACPPSQAVVPSFERLSDVVSLERAQGGASGVKTLTAAAAEHAIKSKVKV